MERKSLEKSSILIYPIHLYSKETKTPDLLSSEFKTIKLSKMNKSNFNTKTQKIIRSTENKNDVFLEKISNLSEIRQWKSQSPVIRKKWIENFIGTISYWDCKNKKLEDLEKSQLDVKNSIAKILKSVSSLRKNPVKGYKCLDF